MSILATVAPMDDIPGTGTLGGIPQQHNWKRAVVRPPPKIFTIQILPATKIGSSYAYGIRVIPLQSDVPDDQSSRSGGSNSSSGSYNHEYDIWRRWEDCMWFQDLLETEYTVMARVKRQRLAAGKGVKKEGLYYQKDQAASFESLPPGPEVNSISKDIHAIVPKLSRKGTFFRPNQATIAQREEEFKAMIEGLFAEEVPTLIRELRDSRVIRDFFGYWVRDRDHDKKAAEKSGKPASRPSSSRGPRSSTAGSTFSMYFSASNISLQLPGAFDLPPSSPTSTAPTRRRRGSDATNTSTISSTTISPPEPLPCIAPATPATGIPFTVSDNGVITPTSPDGAFLPTRASVASIPTSTPRFSTLSSQVSIAESNAEDIPIMFMPTENEDWADSVELEIPGGLQSLPEDQELVPQTARLTMSSDCFPPPTRRSRINSLPDRSSHRNFLVYVPPGRGPAIFEEDALSVDEDPQFHASISKDAAGIPKSPTTSSSSHRSSSTFSISDMSSWRTSRTSFTTMTSRDDDGNSEYSSRQTPTKHDSIASLSSFLANNSLTDLIPHQSSLSASSGLRRSLSAGSRRATYDTLPPLTIPIDEEPWDEHQDEDLLDAYFYDPSLKPPPSSDFSPEEPLSAMEPSPAPPLEHAGPPSDVESEDIPQTPGRERVSQDMTRLMSTPERYPKPFQNRPPGQFHLPWSPQGSPLSSVVSLHPRSPNSPNESFTVKAVKKDTIVLLRANYAMPFEEVRDKLQEKFSMQEGIELSPTFAIGYFVSATPDAQPARSRPRAHSTSSMGPLKSSKSVRYITCDEDWQELIFESPGSKVTIRIFEGF